MRSLSNFSFDPSDNQQQQWVGNDNSQSLPVWGRSAALTFKVMASSQSRTDNNPREESACQERDKSPATTSSSPGRSPLKETSSHCTHRHQQQSYDPPCHSLATISEDRRISSNTLNRITVTKTAKELTAAMTESTTIEKHTESRQQNDDPYFDDNENDDNNSENCFGCWSNSQLKRKYSGFTRLASDSYRRWKIDIPREAQQ